jgi:hypothetical protein
VNLARLVQNARMGDSEIMELLGVTNGYLARVRLEYNRIVEVNSWKAVVSNEVRVYQDFCDRNIDLKKREDDLLLLISKLEAKRAELQNAELN